MRDSDPLAVEYAAAIVDGDVERLTDLLREHPDLAAGMVEDQNGGGCSSLHLLANAPGHRPRAAETVSVLVAAGADLEAQVTGMWHEERPLHWAASNDDVVLIDALLDAGADIEATGSSINGGSPLSSAVGYAQWNAARRLVARDARTDLWHAAALGLLPLVERLVDDEADLDGPLWNACRGGHLATAQFLFRLGASPHWQAPWSGETAFDVARASGNDELVAWLTSATDSPHPPAQE